MSLKIGCLASGSGSNFEAIALACSSGILKDIAEIVVLVSNNPAAKCLERAKKFNIPTVVVPSKDFKGSREEFDTLLVNELNKHGVELVCLAGYMRFVSSVMLNAFKDRVLNIHPALLPSFKGLHAQKQALEYGVKYAGCSVHFVDELGDNGPIIVQKVVPVEDDDTEESLSKRILEQEHIAYSEAIKLLAENKLTIEGRVVKIKK